MTSGPKPNNSHQTKHLYNQCKTLVPSCTHKKNSGWRNNAHYQFPLLIYPPGAQAGSQKCSRRERTLFFFFFTTSFAKKQSGFLKLTLEANHEKHNLTIKSNVRPGAMCPALQEHKPRSKFQFLIKQYDKQYDKIWQTFQNLLTAAMHGSTCL